MEIILDKWNEIINKLKRDYELLDVSFDTLIVPLEVSDVVDGVVYIRVPFEAFYDIVNKRYLLPMKNCIMQVVGQEFDVKFITDRKECVVNKEEPYKQEENVSTTEENLIETTLELYDTEKINFLSEMEHVFAESNLLAKDKMSNRDVVYQLKEVKGLTDLILSRDTGYTLDTLQEYMYNLDLKFSHKEFDRIREDMQGAYTFFCNCVSEINKNISILEPGVYGEDILYNRLKILGNKVRILRNVKYTVAPDFTVEHDMVIISPVGIFSLEIKNWKQDACIDEKGFLVTNEHKMNLVEQVMRHIHNLEQVLEQETSITYNVYPIVVWVNQNAKIKNKFPQMIVCNYNNVEFELFNKDRYSDNYSQEEMNAIYDALKEKALESEEYTYGFTKNEFLKSLVGVIIGIKWISIVHEVEKDITILHKEDIKYRTVDRILFNTRKEAELAREELPQIKAFFDEIKEPTVFGDALTKKSRSNYQEMLKAKRVEFNETFRSEQLKEKYNRVFDTLEQTLYDYRINKKDGFDYAWDIVTLITYFFFGK